MAPSAASPVPHLPNGDSCLNKKPAVSQNGVAHIDPDASNFEDSASRFHQYKNPSLYVTPSHRIYLEETSVPKPTPTEVLIHVRATGVCGSDLHLWHRGAIGPLVVQESHILGHEASGVVLEVGSSVTHLQPGDRVAIEPQVPCHTCFLCTSGKYNLCEKVAFSGVCHGGTIRRFLTHEARYCHKMPDSMTFSQGALLEPLSVILHAIRQCKGSIGIGQPALICGAGPIGLIALAAARASGAWPLVITDVDEVRLDFARQFVPGCQTYHVQLSKSPLEASEEIRLIFGCAGGRDVEKGIPDADEYRAPSTVLECTGIESSVITAAYTCRRAGVVMVVGVGRSIMNNIPFMHLSLAEIELKFINRYNDTWPAGIYALADGKVLNLDSLVTHTFPLEQAVDALELSADKTRNSVKVQIVDDQDIELRETPQDSAS